MRNARNHGRPRTTIFNLVHVMQTMDTPPLFWGVQPLVGQPLVPLVHVLGTDHTGLPTSQVCARDNYQYKTDVRLPDPNASTALGTGPGAELEVLKAEGTDHVRKVPISELQTNVPTPTRDKDDQSTSSNKNPNLLYGLNDLPPAVVVLLLGLQHCLLHLLHCLLTVHAVSPALCLPPDDPARAALLCRLLFLSGISTLLNNTHYGLGLGVVHGPCVSSIGAVLLCLAEDEEAPPSCPSSADLYAMGSERRKDLWQPRMQRIQATLFIAAAAGALLAAIGLPRLLARFQTPMTAAVATVLSILPLVGYIINTVAGNWIATVSSGVFVLLCALILRRVLLPVPVCSVREGKLNLRRLPILSLLAVLLTLLVGWAVCASLTAADLISPENPSSTSEWSDGRALWVHFKPFFSFPWPMPWGIPRLDGSSWTSVTSAVCAAVAANMTSNMAMFYAANVATGDGALPEGRRLQRGCLMSNGASLLAAAWGAPSLVGAGQETSGVTALVQAGPLSAARMSGALLLLLSPLPTVAATLASVPQPLLAGALLAALGAGVGQGLKYLRDVDLRSARNCSILGTSIIVGLGVAGRLGLSALTENGGMESVDAVAAAIVAAGPLAGAALSVVLDAVLPTWGNAARHPRRMSWFPFTSVRPHCSPSTV